MKKSRSQQGERTVFRVWTESLRSKGTQKIPAGIQLFSPSSLIFPRHPSFSEFLRLTGPIPCSHCSLQPWGKQVNWCFNLIINEEFFQCASSFLLLSSDLFHGLLKSASKLGGKVNKRTDRSYSYVVWLEGVFHLQSTLTINYRIHFYSSHFHRTSASEFPSRGEYVT